MKNNLEQLSPVMGPEAAKEALELLEAYDNYILEFKLKLNKLLLPHDCEVKTGIVFTELNNSKE